MNNELKSQLETAKALLERFEMLKTTMQEETEIMLHGDYFMKDVPWEKLIPATPQRERRVMATPKTSHHR